MLFILVLTSGLVLVAVATHYFTLNFLSAFLQSRNFNVRRWVAASILGLLLAHIIEVAMFAEAYEYLHKYEAYGRLVGNIELDDPNKTSYWYYSFVVYTSLGFGDITPTDSLRLMTALETLTGLILIAWSASFLYMQMHRYWDEPNKDSKKQ